MRVAVDAAAARSRSHGIGSYVAGLLTGLAAADANGDYDVFTCRHAIRDFQPLGLPTGRVRFRPVTANRPLRLFWEAYGLPLDARRVGADVLWGCHNSLPMLKCCPQVVTIHDLGMLTVPHFYPRAKVIYFRRAIPHAVEVADIVVADSEYTRGQLVEILGVAERKLRVVLCGVGDQFRVVDASGAGETVRRRYKLPDEFILALGVPEPKKNLERVMGAHADLRTRYPRFPPLVIAGARDYGWSNDRLFAAAAASGSGVVLTGRIQSEDLPQVYRLAKFFVFPSLFEGFGLPPIEAMACGTPVITSNAASLPEVAGGAALLVDPESQAEIAAAMLRLNEEGGLREQLRVMGRANVRRFRWDDAARAMLGIFREACSR